MKRARVLRDLTVCVVLVHERRVRFRDAGDVHRPSVDRLHREQTDEFGSEAGEQGRSREVLHDVAVRRLADGGELGVDADELVETLLELWVVRVDDLRENRRRSLVRLVDHVHVELRGVQTERFVEFRAAVVVQVHGDVHG